MSYALMIVHALAISAAGATEQAPRIVSLSPHITELLFAAGAGERVVGVDSASDYPAAATAVPHVGEVPALDIERLLGLRPDVVIYWQSGTPARAVAQLERLHLRVYPTEQRRLSDIGRSLVEFGRLAGTMPLATAAAASYAAQLAALRSRYSGRRHLTVFYQVWDRPLYTLSGEHVVSEVLSLCGGDNIFVELKTLAPVVDREAVVARDPDVILIGARGAEGERLAEDWRRLPGMKAVRYGSIESVDPSLVSRMSPRILSGVQQVCERLDEARHRVFPDDAELKPAVR